MRRENSFYNKINTRILVMMFILFAVATIVVSTLNQVILSDIYRENFNKRTLLTNQTLADSLSKENIEYYVNLLTNQDEDFKKRQIQFQKDRNEWIEKIEELENLQKRKGTHEKQLILEKEIEVLRERVQIFTKELNLLKDDVYWQIVEDIRYLKDISESKYVYILADTGVRDEDGTPYFSFIFDANDSEVYDDPSSDGLGTVEVPIDEEIILVENIYKTGEKMQYALRYDGYYGELYYAYAPIVNENNKVIAILGNDVSLEEMNDRISSSMLLFSAVFLSFAFVIIMVIYLFMKSCITQPLVELTDTAESLANGNVYAPIPKKALKQRSELGSLAQAMYDMSIVYQSMIKNTADLFAAANIGKLDIRSDVSKYKGGIKKLIQQINATLDAMTLYLNGVPEGIFIMSKDFEVYFRNEQYINFLGEMSISEFFELIFQETDSELMKKRFSQILANKNNNTTLWIDEYCFSITFKEINLNEVIKNSILVVIIDITDLMNQKEKANEATRAKSDFLSSMSHEIRTPLNAINGMTAIGKAASDIEKKNYSFDKIESASTHLLGIINDILDISKIEANKLELSIEEFNFERMLRKVVDIMNFRIDEKNQTLYVNIDKDIPERIISDDQRLTQVITNLLSNAVKFTPENGMIHLNTHLVEEADDFCVIQIEVEDTGIGISPEQQDKLFSSFQQADNSISRNFGGTGLGLAISKAIIEMMDGDIWIHSELEKGATFFFTIKAEKGKAEKQSLLNPAINKSNIHVLMVDDDIKVLEYFKQIAHNNLGIYCDVASGGQEALKLLERNQYYDVYFVDWKMPGMNGIELSKEIIKNQDGKFVVIMVSSSEWSIIANDAKEAGINKFLSKPLFASDIIGCISECLGVNDISKTEADSDTTVDIFAGCRLLLAEDIEINREIVLTMLESTEIEIDCAENGEQALQMFSQNLGRYNMIFMDMQMPEVDGLEATRRIRALDAPQAKTIPIIAMTANVFREDIEKCLNAGMNDHIGKPLNFDDILDKLRIYLPKNIVSDH